MLKIINANRLSDGSVVYMNAGHQWVGNLDQAVAFVTPEALDAGLQAAAQDAKANRVVDVFAFDAEHKDGSLRAVTLRDRIRAGGPTIDYLPHDGSRDGAHVSL